MQRWKTLGTSLAVQWLRLHSSTAGGVGLIPDWRTKIPHVRVQPRVRGGGGGWGRGRKFKKMENSDGNEEAEYLIY